MPPVLRRRAVPSLADLASQREEDPRTYRISPHFVLSDFLGCHSVYSRGLANPFVFDDSSEQKLENIRALCDEALEPIMAQFGPLSVSYGYISPEVSRAIVGYQDPDKPSHHRWDLGAAADICAHRWVHGDFPTVLDLYAPGSSLGSPIALAHGVDYLEVPYSRMITYSESPYICIAVSAREVVSDRPRKAFYENRYQGVPKAKPDYRQYPTAQARARALDDLQTNGLEHPWQGAGYPTYHGGGIRQYHHMRVSKYTMVSDWLFDLKSISTGAKNIPALNDDRVLDAFAAAGMAYDHLIDSWGIPRASIVEGYVSHLNPSSADYNDWREPTIRFLVNPPPVQGEFSWIEQADFRDGLQLTMEDGFVVAVVDVETVLATWEAPL